MEKLFQRDKVKYIKEHGRCHGEIVSQKTYTFHLKMENQLTWISIFVSETIIHGWELS